MAQIPRYNADPDNKKIFIPPVIYQPIALSDSLRKSYNNAVVNSQAFDKSQVGVSDADKTAAENRELESNSRVQSSVGDDGGDDGGGGGGGDSEDGFSIFKIFKIVPIGLNVLAKGPVLASGFADLVEGTTKSLINLSLSAVDLFTHTFQFGIQGAKFLFILLLCMVENLSRFNVCIVFYIIDLICLIVYLFLFSFLNLVDELFFRRMTGMSLVGLIMSGYPMIVQLNDLIHDMTGFHIIHYPDTIITMCYTCSFKLNRKETGETGSNLLHTVTGVIPGRLTEPIAVLTSAITKMTSVFNL